MWAPGDGVIQGPPCGESVGKVACGPPAGPVAGRAVYHPVRMPGSAGIGRDGKKEFGFDDKVM